ncbi:hypothetical protein CEXT_111961 [Caerostris extrusa]|uniref:Uncharacterized protein n=1 Tax=Caerostris extrusa TaxID=172846 RepID=A0AAV4RRR4_CAEEX|nr:hypothetical protein CEXT_111961 [Caerostris extrusa]
MFPEHDVQPNGVHNFHDLLKTHGSHCLNHFLQVGQNSFVMFDFVRLSCVPSIFALITCARPNLPRADTRIESRSVAVPNRRRILNRLLRNRYFGKCSGWSCHCVISRAMIKLSREAFRVLWCPQAFRRRRGCALNTNLFGKVVDV